MKNSGSSLSSSSSGVSSSSETSNSNTKTLSTSLPRKLSPAGLQGARREVDYRLSLPLAVARSSGPSSPEGKFQGQGHIVRVTMDVDGSSCVVYKSIWVRCYFMCCCVMGRAKLQNQNLTSAGGETVLPSRARELFDCLTTTAAVT